MKIELNIDQTNIGTTVEDIFKQLTPEQKFEIALQVTKNWLKENEHMSPVTLKKLAEEKANAELPAEGGYGWKYTEALNKHAKELTARNTAVVNAVICAMTEQLKTACEVQIKQSPEMQAMLATMVEQLKLDYPKFVHDAMIVWFASHMENVSQGVTTALMQSSRAETISDAVNRRIG